MNKEFVEVLEHSGKGYKPVVEYGFWKVAVLNSIDKYKPENISYMERHLETDEVFILLQGECKLLIGGKGEHPEHVSGEWMAPGKIYNIKKNVWHTTVLLEDTSVIIVENADTNVNNTQYETMLKEGDEIESQK